MITFHQLEILKLFNKIGRSFMCITIKIAKEVNLDIVEENKITFNDIDFNYIKANRKIT